MCCAIRYDNPSILSLIHIYVDLNRRLVCLDLKKLGAGLRTIAMLIMQDLVNSQVSHVYKRQTNNNAEIRRVKTRIEQLSKQAQREFSGWEFDGGRVEMNREDNRLQVFFDGKPDADTRAELKSSGFRWAPSVGAWQRQLTDNAIRAADRLECIKPVSYTHLRFLSITSLKL